MEIAELVNAWVVALTSVMTLAAGVWAILERWRRGDTEKIATDAAEGLGLLAGAIEALHLAEIARDPDGEGAAVLVRLKKKVAAMAQTANLNAEELDEQIQLVASAVLRIAHARPEALEDGDAVGVAVRSGLRERVQAMKDARAS